ncbi:MAG: CDP-alcohol phosphatidyltransferase family protein [Hyphomicrobiales bacterium]|nr:MAG: CDP-alcohol phosphatidyltransferase family protein [Hyphomicrobiales bacterium]
MPRARSGSCRRWRRRASPCATVVALGSFRRDDAGFHRGPHEFEVRLDVLKLNIPNFITIARVMSVPVIFWLLVTGETRTAFFVFVAAGASDALDGYLAKRFSWQTELGAILDPMADKLLLVSLFIALGVAKELPLWLVIAVVSRDILIVLAVMVSWVMSQPVAIKPLVISKINTLFQIVLVATVLADAAFGLGLGMVRSALVWITGTLTLLSLAAYLRGWFTHMTGS